MLKFEKHYVTDGKVKARVWYSVDNRIDQRLCVTIYAKDYTQQLANLFGRDYRNDSDVMTDYFEKGRVVLFEDHQYYEAARERAVSVRPSC